MDITSNRRILWLSACALLLSTTHVGAHGTIISPMSRVYRVYQSNPSNPNFQLAQNAVAIDGELSYYTWNEVSRNIFAAVQAGLPPGFDYSPWVPDGELASGGRTDPNSTQYPRTYAGLDQVSADWPTTPVTAGAVLPVDFLVTAQHTPSAWDVWMTTPDWTPTTELNWSQMEYLGRPQVSLASGHYLFDVTIPANRDGHHVLWVAWHRNDPVGEVFFSTCDVFVSGAGPGLSYCGPAVQNSTGASATIAAFGSDVVAANDFWLRGSDLPLFSSAYFLVSPARAFVMNPGGSAGTLCLGPPHGRFVTQVQNSGMEGTVRINVNLSQLPRPAGPVAVQPGETWDFQLWYRDSSGGSATSNFTDALEVTFQ